MTENVHTDREAGFVMLSTESKNAQRDARQILKDTAAAIKDLRRDMRSTEQTFTAWNGTEFSRQEWLHEMALEISANGAALMELAEEGNL